MSDFQLYAVHGGDLFALPVPKAAKDVHDLFHANSALGPAVPSVYSALRSYHHDRFLRLDAHLERCRLSSERAGFSANLDPEGLKRAIHAAVSARPPADVCVRFDLLARSIVADGTTTRVLLGVAPHAPVPPVLLRDGVRLGLAPAGLFRSQPLIKFAAWVNDRRVCRERDPNAYEHLLVDENQRVLEATSSNFFAVRGQQVITASDGVLEGITRKIVLELARRRGLGVELKRPTLEELDRVDEAFITSSTREVVPATSLAGRAIGAGKPGAVTLALMADYQRYAQENAKPALAG